MLPGLWDLKAFAAAENQKGAVYNEPVEITGLGSVPKIGVAPSFAKTRIRPEKRPGFRIGKKLFQKAG